QNRTLRAGSHQQTDAGERRSRVVARETSVSGRRLSILLTGGTFFEGPRWHDGRWWVSNMFGPHVFAVTPDGGAEEVLRAEGRPSGLGWLPDGSLLVVSMSDQKLLRRS